MTPTMRRQISKATAKALENIDEVFVAPPGPRPSGGCISCGEMRPIVEPTDCCDECSEILFEMYPETRP